MDFCDTVRERARALLTTGQPTTSIDIAARLGTTRAQTARALRQIEQEGAATRRRGGMSRAGRIPDQWTASR